MSNRRCGPVAQAAARLRKRRAQWFTFLDVPGGEATNNRAERALRPALLAPKRSCGNQTARRARTWEMLASLAPTAAQRGQDFVQWLAPHLRLDTVAACETRTKADCTRSTPA